ncbi:Mitochondrial carrier domain-containing protein [Cynara cardunculus var. scolymus]|uniref:Mitochondrial carrier domain-containing protein n=1 Tax=Cynara cardunculus var. scolymus TaxID=59895 RepID=A0A118K5Z3_CYNCS|nr:Mitochondrial carrier domain-containing protein [Cynara cardunculus var. scolymus]
MQTEARVGVEGGGPAHKLVTRHQRPLQHHGSQIGAIHQLIAGGVAGAVSKTCTAPLARLTILFQVQGMHSDVSTLRKASIWHEASRIIREEGFRAFWKGNLVTITHRLPYSSISFYAFEHYKNVGTNALSWKFLHLNIDFLCNLTVIRFDNSLCSLLMLQLLQQMSGVETHETNFGNDVFVRLAAGGLAGVTAASVTYPLDLIRTRLSAQVRIFGMHFICIFFFFSLLLIHLLVLQTNVNYYRGIWHALHTISREEGIFGLYKGLGACLLGVGPNLAISFSVYHTARSYWQLQRPDDSTVMVGLACGSLSGIASSTVSFPLDLVRRRMQLEGAAGWGQVYKTGVLGTFGHILRAEGLRGLYRGILPEYYKVVPSIGIVFMTYEKLKQVLSDIDAC